MPTLSSLPVHTPFPTAEREWGGQKRKKTWLGRSIPLGILAGAQIELSVGIEHSLLNSRLLWPYEGQHPADSKQGLGHAKLWDCHEELNGFLHHCRENSCDSAALPQFPLKRPLKQIHRSTGLTASFTSIWRSLLLSAEGLSQNGITSTEM